nr:tyrosine-protein kinase PRAG1 isoform X2 [Pelodiscus sinensis]|eukprot:XP_014430237.1 tyrosine-protein kinase PRAG1 isoform X2 [Pelodiscus sinensis]
MQRAICVNQEGLKMSVCSHFVEHVWKPGSCKNCFCPKRSHRLQASLEPEASNLPSRNLNGIRTKAEAAPPEDESGVASPYSKPTIAVKPTRINPDVSDAWADVNMNADISQVSWRMASENQPLAKPGEAQRTGLDHFSSSAVRKPFLHATPNDCVPPCRQGCSRGGLESRGERAVPFRSLALEGGWEDRAVLRNKEKFAFPQRGLCQPPSALADSSPASTPDSTGWPRLGQGEGTTLSSVSSDGRSSPGTESESGDYCSIARCSMESPAPSPQGRVAWSDGGKPAPRFWGWQDAAASPQAKARAVQRCEEEGKRLDVDSGFQRERCLRDSPQKNARPQRNPLALLPGAAALSDGVLSRSGSSSPLALPQENDYCALLEPSPLPRGSPVENASDVPSPAPASRPAQHAQPAPGEPIYAESTKRKKVQPNSSGAPSKREGPARSPLREQAWSLWREGPQGPSNGREYQDPATQVAAKITIMAAHTEEDNRTIFLSSPDSAVGVQWPCASPTSHPDFAMPSPSFGHREGSQAGREMGSGESSPWFHQPTQTQGIANESPTVPPKLPTSSPSGSEGVQVPSVSCPGTEIWGGNHPSDASTQFSSQNCPEPGPSGAPPSLCSPAEEPSRGAPGPAYERRQKYSGTAWSRQCRIEEEEEEGPGFLTGMQAREAENGAACLQHVEGCSGQGKKPGMSKSASFAFDFPKDRSETEEFAPPPPPPKKQPRHALKMNKSSSELEKVSNGSAESPPFRESHVRFVAGSTDSLSSDTRTASEEGSTQDRSLDAPEQPPPLPQKKTICKTPESKVSASYHSPSVPVHFNIQQDCGHFVASVPSSMLLSADVANSTPPSDGPGLSRSSSEQDCVVVITREVPQQTAADFVRETAAYHQSKPELYERRVTFLLLQLCHGLEHLKDHSIIHRDLCLENLLLVHCKPLAGGGKAKEEKHLPRLIVSNFLKAKQKPGTGDSKLKKNQARLAPEIVSASQYKKFDEFQTGILIYELLHRPNPFEVRPHLREQDYSRDDLPPLPSLSIYSRGLQQLAHLLLEADPIKRVCITEAKRMLQCLLWGPRKDLTDQPRNHEEVLCSALQNWIDMKRALLMMKFAERAVDTERSVELEDWLCCQYLASADPASLLNTLKLLQLL